MLEVKTELEYTKIKKRMFEKILEKRFDQLYLHEKDDVSVKA